MVALQVLQEHIKLQKAHLCAGIHAGKGFFSLKASEIFNNKKLLFFAKKSTFFYKKKLLFFAKKSTFFWQKKVLLVICSLKIGSPLGPH